jgi:2-keto-4-pentenoate hydratase/2-oxohepta-3-ene-1,7-dioic acid hydratase in catechol pathway
MKIANLDGRATLVTDSGAVDIAVASDGRYGPDPQGLFDDWAGFRDWAATASIDQALAADGAAIEPSRLGAPVPRPRQVIAIGVNYTEHAAEAGYPDDSLPITFTKFPSSIVGPGHVVKLPEGHVDWEVELVVAMATEAHDVPRASAWDYIAGVTVGQDLSERLVQNEGSRPQYSLGKSFPGFGPTGPWLVTPDELADRDDLAISCTLDGETMQTGRTSAMIYTVPILIERLSAILTLYPGDIIFTGTPAGVGNARTPKRFIQPTEVLVSTIEGIGELTTRFAS